MRTRAASASTKKPSNTGQVHDKQAYIAAQQQRNASAKSDELLGSHNRERLQIKWLKTQLFRLIPLEFAYASNFALFVLCPFF